MKKIYLSFGNIHHFNQALKRRLKNFKKLLIRQLNLETGKLKSVLVYDKQGRLKKAAFVLASTFVGQGALAQSFEKVSTIDNPFIWEAENYELVASDDKYYIYLRDLDGDDNPELIFAHFFDYSVYSNTSGYTLNTSIQSNLNALSVVESENHMVWGDLDGDDDMDFVGYDDDLEEYVFVENIGSSSVPNFSETTTNPFEGLAFGTDPILALVDLDNDGDLDLYACDKYGDAQYFENQGSSSTYNFVEQTDADNPFDGLEPVNDAGSNGGLGNPVFTDIDNDGDKDLLISNLDGFLKFYENTGNATTPSFALNTTYLADINSLLVEEYAVTDLDNDGIKDLLVSNDDSDDIYQIINLGTAANPDFSFKRGSELPAEVVPDFVDIDNDNDYDVVVAHDRLEIMQNNGDNASPSYSYINTGDIFFAVGIYYPEQISLVDLDNDGDDDLLRCEEYNTPSMIGNNGTANSPDFGTIGTNPFESLTLASGSIGRFVDIDGDDDFDYFNISSADNDYYKNDGTQETVDLNLQVTNPLSVLDPIISNISSFDFVDLDGDDDYDLAVTLFTGTGILYYENTGSPTVPAFTEATGIDNPFNGLTIENDSKISFADLDNDGDEDFILGKTDGTIDYYMNTSPISSIFGARQSLKLVAYPNPTNGVIYTTNIESGRFQLTSMTGEIVKTGTVSNKAIDLSNVEAGIYILSVDQSNGTYTTRIEKY